MFVDAHIIENQIQLINSKERLLGKNRPEKSHKETEDIGRDNKAQ